MKRIIILLMLAFSGFLVLEAQNTCMEQLRQAQISFDDGLLDNIPDDLAACMKDGFTKEEKANAYKLLMQTYLFSEQIEEADKVMIEFLTDFPSYIIEGNDPKEFINLYNTYRTEPIFKIEATVGLSFCVPLISQYRGVTNIEKSKPTYQPKIGFAAEVNYIGAITTGFSYSAGASFTYLSMEYTNIPFDYTTVSGNISNMYVGLPLAMRYNHTLGIIDLFAKAGLEPVYHVYSSVNLTREDELLGVGAEPIPGTPKFTKSHKILDLRPFVGLGIELNLGRDQLIITAGYKSSIFSQLKDEELYSKMAVGNPSDRLLYLEDDMYLNQATFSLSYIRPIYKPKKIR
jgi:hypothetical protein